MIFVTVGAQMPFDRLIKAVDQWAGEQSDVDVFAQIGPAEYVPQHMRWTRFLEPPAFHHAFDQAQTIVAHAGMGSIISALEYHKPILVMPRRGHLHETRNDHQYATARHFHQSGQIHVAFDEQELVDKLNALDQITARQPSGAAASSELIQALARFIDGDGLPATPPEKPETVEVGSH